MKGGVSLFLEFTLPTALEVLLLVTALSIDAFLASFVYGSNRIQIPLTSVVTISGICSAVLALSLAAGGWISHYLPARVDVYKRQVYEIVVLYS